ncbi:MAG: ABC transporter ATP-binding protein [Candidatus Hodarchaeales archaeon]|jgi:ABC-type multidrug transport system fused ATPase/permease subunit
MAWHLRGSLEKEQYDKQYTDKVILKRLLSYLINHKIYLSIVIIFSLASTIVSLIVPWAFALGLDELFKDNPRYNFILFTTIAYLFLLSFEWILGYFSQVNNRKLQSHVVYDLRLDMFTRINKHELSFFDKNKTGKIMARVSGDTFQVGGVLTTVVDLGSVTLRASLIIIIMLLIDWQLAILSMLVFPILFLIVYVLRRVIRRYSLLQRRAQSTLNAYVEEQISGIQITKSFGQEENVIHNFKKLQDEKVSVNIRQMTLYRMFNPLFTFLTALGLFLLLIGGGNAILSGTLTPGFLYLFITYLRRLFYPLIQLSTFYASLQGGLTAGERIFSLMDVPVSITPGKMKAPLLQGEIEFKNVFFSYDKDLEPVFKEFDLHIPAGQTIAIVGETGSGKTSLASLLARFYEYKTGEIILDGQYSLKDIEADSLRDQLGYVLQEPFLFSGTILDNLLLGSPDATDDRVSWALHAVGADSFIQLLPEQINTPIKERGRGLSQGQRQLLSLARILLKDPRILILDEATASVDAYTEHMIQEALSVVFKNRTTIVIAHRLSTILNADRIIVLDNGQIVGEGTHEELITQKGRYRDLYFTYYAHQGALDELTLKKAPLSQIISQ